ncbi:hypothetical protein OOT00_09745 [Desulfobotulus sp. H1]|uniref:DUF3592 domain-containing protein n=1 Tax=Desulfobotulus pelophilus TaxID=2823377 RepID=A0ABT3N9X7_9BACT|nr:hypothetical protein [Desulfobotulus pelophilus]MCW7754269.1 hypothetical protein [Desulfobotulus pelophilus]
MGDTTGLIMGISLAILIALVLGWRSQKKMAQTWQGRVTRITTISGIPADDENGNYTEDQIMVQYLTDEGKKGKFRLEKKYFLQNYPDLQINDRLVKEAGKELPKKA